MVALHAAGDLLAMSEANTELHQLILQASRHETARLGPRARAAARRL